MTREEVDEYIRQIRVPVYDVGPLNLLKFGSVLRLVQETSEQHLDLLHISYEEFRAQGYVFFIISSRVKIKRMPEHNELLTIKTHPRGRGGAQFYRDFKFYGEDGQLIIDVMQTTVVADATTHKVQRPQSLFKYGIFRDFPIEKEERITRINIPENLPFAGDRLVYYSDLDSNSHMNNSVYGDVLVDFLPDGINEKQMSQVQITYINETPLGDTLKIYAGVDGKQVLMRGDNKKGGSFTACVLLAD